MLTDADLFDFELTSQERPLPYKERGQDFMATFKGEIVIEGVYNVTRDQLTSIKVKVNGEELKLSKEVKNFFIALATKAKDKK